MAKDKTQNPAGRARRRRRAFATMPAPRCGRGRDAGADHRGLSRLGVRSLGDQRGGDGGGAGQVPARRRPAERGGLRLAGRGRELAGAALRPDGAAGALLRAAPAGAADAVSALPDRAGLAQREAGAGAVPAVLPVRCGYGGVGVGGGGCRDVRDAGRGAGGGGHCAGRLRGPDQQPQGVERCDARSPASARSGRSGGAGRAARHRDAGDRQARPARRGRGAGAARAGRRGRERRLYPGRGARGGAGGGDPGISRRAKRDDGAATCARLRELVAGSATGRQGVRELGDDGRTAGGERRGRGDRSFGGARARLLYRAGGRGGADLRGGGRRRQAAAVRVGGGRRAL